MQARLQPRRLHRHLSLQVGRVQRRLVHRGCGIAFGANSQGTMPETALSTPATNTIFPTATDASLDGAADDAHDAAYAVRGITADAFMGATDADSAGWHGHAGHGDARAAAAFPIHAANAADAAAKYARGWNHDGAG